MSRYSKVTRRMWRDEKFRKLSAPPPCGQSLWMYLLTAPENSSIPGLFCIGLAQIAENLKWSLEGTRLAFEEARGLGMVEADWDARLMWIPNAVAHNKPESAKVILGWRTALSELPECPLLTKALRGIRAIVETMEPSYLEAFKKVTGDLKPTRKPSAKASRKPTREPTREPSGKGMPYQEQEQEQEQEQLNPPTPRRGDAEPERPERSAEPDAPSGVLPVLAPPPPDPTDTIATRPDGAFGFEAAAYAEGIRAVMGKCTVPRYREAGQLADVLREHAEGANAQQRCAWIQAKAEAFARQTDPAYGGISVHKFVAWLNGGCAPPPQTRSRPTVVQPLRDGGRLWKTRAEKDAELEAEAS